MRYERHYFVYMIASISRVLYIGMTSNLHKRVWEHKNEVFDGFSKHYKCHRLVWYESYDDVANAIDREKQLKRWNRNQERMADRDEEPDVGGFSRGVVPRATAQAASLMKTIFSSTVIPSGANRLRSERCGVEGPAVGLRKSWRMREESLWRKQKAGPSTRELIGKADQFTWSG